MEQDLIIYPTTRAIREATKSLAQDSKLLPKMMTIDEFERRLAIAPNRVMVDAIERVLFLQEASNFDEFKLLQKERELLRFFLVGDDFFRFFEELALERVELDELLEADAYGEFAKHIEILKRLRERYQKILDSKNLIDRMFLPENYELNRAFLATFSGVQIYLEGVLGRFELELLEAVAKEKELTLHLRANRFNLKLIERLRDLGIDIPKEEGDLILSLDKKQVVEFKPNPLKLKAKVLATQERYEQIALALAEIEKMVQSNIKPEKIALILPDESLAEIVELYDRHNNFNFAKGYDYLYRDRGARVIDTLEKYLRTKEESLLELLVAMGLDNSFIESLKATMSLDIDGFFKLLEEFNNPHLITPKTLSKADSEFYEQLLGAYYRLESLFKTRKLTLLEWLYCYREVLSEIRVDDTRGGKVTVMGVLETRGVSFDGVVILDFNEGIVPAKSSKDRFLNSSIRRFAKLPTKQDRSSLQKYYYSRLMERAKSLTIIYSKSDNRLPSPFIYELNLPEAIESQAPRSLLYSINTPRYKQDDIVVEDFNPKNILWSATMLKVYLECPRRFYYQYIEKLKDNSSSDELNEGRLAHTLLQRLYKNRSQILDKDLAKREIEEILEDLLPLNPKGNYLKILLKKRLDRFISWDIERFRDGWQVKEVEYSIKGNICGLNFCGKIDRVDENSSNLLLIDYKTGSTKGANSSKKSLDNMSDFQMPLYTLLLKERFSNIEPVFFKIFENRIYEPLRDIEAKSELLKEHLEKISLVDTLEAKKTDNLKVCEYCPYTLLCERGKYL